MNQLSTGVLNKISNGEAVENPIFLQFLGSKLISNGRLRLSLSDGVTSTSYAIITQNDMNRVANGSLTENAVCKITDFFVSKSKAGGVPVIVVKFFEIVHSGEETGETIGTPVPLETNINEPRPEEVQVPVVHSSPIQPPASQNIILTVPIMSLSPYYGKWTIRARVTAKSEIRFWNNPRSQGKLFSMDLIDESGEIRCMGFNDQVDTFYDLLEKGSIYYMAKCQVKPANKRYSTIRHEFELSLNSDSAILKYHGDSSTIPMIQFDFSPISEIEWRETGSVLDILAVVKSVGNVMKLKSRKDGTDLLKKDIILVDDSNTMVTLTLWGKQADEFILTGNSPTVLAIKTVSIKEFNGGKSLTTGSSTIIQANPAILQTEGLLAWFNDTSGAKDAKFLSIQSLSSSINYPWLSFRSVRELNLGISETNNIFLTKAAIGTIRSDNAMYKACPSEGCKKKVVDNGNGTYHCVKCNQDFPNFNYKLIMQATLLDFSDEMKVTIFDSEAEKIVQKTANELGEIYDHFPTDVYEDIFNNCKLQEFIFKIRMKQEVFNNVSKIRAVVLNISPVNAIDNCLHLIKKLKPLLDNQSS